MCTKVRTVVGKLFGQEAVGDMDLQGLHDVLACMQRHGDTARMSEFEAALRKPRYHMLMLVHAFFAAGYLKSDHDLRRCCEQIIYLTLPVEAADVLSGCSYIMCGSKRIRVIESQND